VISARENTAVALVELPPLRGSDRQAAHYHRAQHARARQHQERFQQSAQAAEKIIVQLLVLLGHLLQQIFHHTLTPSQLVCPWCGKVRPELSLREESQEIGWEVRLVRRRYVRFRYGPSCQCPPGRGIRTAPKPAKLIAKGLLAVDFWVEVLLKKFEFAQPLQRTIREVAAHGMHVSGGTLSGGLKKIKDLVEPLAGQFVLQSRQGTHWHLDETRWPMFDLPAAPGRAWW
jgi:hypothetical protein